MRRVGAVVVVLLALMTCAAGAQEVPTIRFDAVTDIYLRAAVAERLFVVKCGRVLDESLSDVVIGDLVEPEVDHEAMTLLCPGTHEVIVRTQMPDEACLIMDYEKQVFKVRPERFRVLACKFEIHTLMKKPAISTKSSS